MSEGDRNTIESQGAQAPGFAERLGRRALLLVLSPNFFGSCRIIDAPAIVIGRAADCDFVLADPLLSRKHCRITTGENGDAFIEDLNSRNATFLNQRKVQGKVQLHYSDRILIGDTIVRFLVEESIGPA